MRARTALQISASLLLAASAVSCGGTLSFQAPNTASGATDIGIAPQPTETPAPVATSTPTSTPTSPPVTPPTPDQAVLLNGTSGLIAVTGPSIPLDGTSQLTVEMYLKPTAVSGDFSLYSDNTGLSLAADFMSGSHFGVMANNNGTTSLCVNGGGNSGQGSTVTPSAGTIYHVGFTWNATANQLALFVNGQVFGPVALGNAVTGGCAITSITIGANRTPGNFFNGAIDEVRISNNLRYTAAYTAPTGPLVKDANTLVLVHFGAGASSSAANNTDFPIGGAGVWQLFGGASFLTSPF